MAKTSIETTRINVVDEQGNRSYLVCRTPVVTDSTFDGPTVHRKRSTLTTPAGEHVNVLSDTEFETLNGKRWRKA